MEENKRRNNKSSQIHNLYKNYIKEGGEDSYKKLLCELQIMAYLYACSSRYITVERASEFLLMMYNEFDNLIGSYNLNYKVDFACYFKSALRIREKRFIDLDYNSKIKEDALSQIAYVEYVNNKNEEYLERLDERDYPLSYENIQLIRKYIRYKVVQTYLASIAPYIQDNALYNMVSALPKEEAMKLLNILLSIRKEVWENCQERRKKEEMIANSYRFKKLCREINIERGGVRGEKLSIMRYNELGQAHREKALVGLQVPYSVIAKHMNISTNTVGSNIIIAKKLLKGIYDKGEIEDEVRTSKWKRSQTR